LDDILYKKGGGFSDWNRGRASNLEGWSLETYIFSKNFSQRGGLQKEEAGKSNSRTWINPELNYSSKGGLFNYYFLMSPNIQYDTQKFKTESKDFYYDGELLTGFEKTFKNSKINFELGRGYQRSDAYGFIYMGFGNFAELSWKWNQLKLGSLVNKHQTGWNQGNTIQWESDSWIESVRLYHYQYFQTLYNQSENNVNLPKGSFQYKGMDIRFKWNQSNLVELGAFQVEGIQKYSTNTIEFEKIIGSIGYGIYRKTLDQNLISIGGLFSTRDKDSESKNDKTREGYNPILSEIRIFGGKSSFLINENISGSAPLVFGDLENPYNKGFSNNGINLVGLELTRTLNSHSFSLLTNTSYSGLGRGAEGILRWIYHPQENEKSKGYISASVCLARVRPITPEKIYLSDWETQGPIREFFRLYLSMGILF
jgi:hypothetical protein